MFGIGIKADPAMPSAARRQVTKRPIFYLAMALLISAMIVAGLSFDVPKYVLHPTAHRPVLLAVHSVVFIGWMIVYVAQNMLVYARKIRWHRMLGWVGMTFAVLVPPLGIATAIVMRRFDLATFPSSDFARDLAFLAAPLSDIVAFTPCVLAGIAMRRRPDYHRRLMYLSIASIAEAGFGRFPLPGTATWFFGGNVLLYLAAIAHDKYTRGQVHRVYRIGVPLLVLNEATAMYLWLMHPAWWLSACRWMLRFG